MRSSCTVWIDVDAGVYLLTYLSWAQCQKSSRQCASHTPSAPSLQWFVGYANSLWQCYYCFSASFLFRSILRPSFAYVFILLRTAFTGQYESSLRFGANDDLWHPGAYLLSQLRYLSAFVPFTVRMQASWFCFQAASSFAFNLTRLIVTRAS